MVEEKETDALETIVANQEVKNYYKKIFARAEEQLELAKKVRNCGLDVSREVESVPAMDLAERTERIIGPKGISARFRALYKETKEDRLEAIFKIFKEILEQKFVEIPDREKRLEQAVKSCLMLLTEGVVVAPIDGVPKVKISKNFDGSEFVDIYFAGPIRAAGGTATVFPLILGDYARKLMDLDRYKPTDSEVERYVEETQIYDEIFTRQYKLTPDEVRKIIRGCPVCINGEPTEEREVVANKDLERIPTNRVRGGTCLVISEGIALKAMKIMIDAKRIGLDWSWLEEIVKVKKSQDSESKPSAKYLGRIAAGRPIFCYPSRIGGLRLRYGRSRNSGIMGKAMHPATMHTLGEFVAVGTQLKVERPGKSAGIFPCDTIEGPIVKLSNDDVVKIGSIEKAIELEDEVKEILFLGDYLVSYGDFRHTAHPLLPVGYCEEWWALELEKATKKKKVKGFDFKEIAENPMDIDGFTAVELSMQLGIPLHPEYLHYYKAINREKIIELIKKFRKAEKKYSEEKIVGIEIDFDEKVKESLDSIGLPHAVREEKIIVGEKYAYPFMKTIGALDEDKIPEGEDVIELLSEISGIKIRDKAGTFIGARMGRPEQAKPRKMVGNPNILFPIGLYGGGTRLISKAASKPNITVEIAKYKCPDCNAVVPFASCPHCNCRTEKVWCCEKCGSEGKDKHCEKCGGEGISFNKRQINLNELMQIATENLRVKLPENIKGVKGLINEGKVAEPLEKGILRAYHDLHVFRDATIRFEMLNAPLTHFKPAEIKLSVEKAKELGYGKDIYGKELTDTEQILELFPQDIIINDAAGDFFVKVTNFIDDLLEKFYGMKAYYNVTSRDELIGELLLSLAPHTSAAVVGRLLGYTAARVNFAHPFYHLAKRRNCLVPETPVLLEKDGQRKLVNIGELDNGSANKEQKLEGFFAYAVNEKGKLRRRKVSSLVKLKAPKKIFVIKTKYGRTIKATADHKLLCVDKGSLVKKKVAELSGNEKLASLAVSPKGTEIKKLDVLEWYMKNSSKEEKRKLRVHGCRGIMRKYAKEYGGFWKLARDLKYRNGKAMHTAVDFDSVPLEMFEKIVKKCRITKKDFWNAEISYNKQKSRIPSKIAFGKELGELIGLYLSDGYARTTDDGKREKYVYQISIASSEKDVAKRILQHILNVFGRKATVEKRKNLTVITLSGRVYYDFFVRILKSGKGAYSKRVPAEILNSNKACKEGLVAGYIVGDGNIDGASIKISSVNENLLNDIGLILLDLDVFPHYFEQKEREVKSGFVQQFYSRKGKIKTTKDMGIRLYSTDVQEIGKLLFGRKLSRFRKISKKGIRGKRIKKIGNFVVDGIKEIREIKSKAKYVYDLVVEGEKSFIGGFGSLAVYDCDGEQDSVMLLTDVLINFSESYLPASRGGRMDAPLVFTLALNPLEIDDEAYDMEICSKYSLELYEKSQKIVPPEIDSVKKVKDVLGTEEQYRGMMFTHHTSRMDAGPKYSKYVRLTTMEDKINSQATLQNKIRAVDKKDALERVLVSHFLPDIIGNARAFSKQTFRCTNCNTIYRRIPLSGKCNKCKQGNIVLTIAQGSVRKYLEIAKKIIYKYNLSDYLKQRIKLTEEEVNSLFSNEKVTQKSLSEFV